MKASTMVLRVVSKNTTETKPRGQ